MKGKRRIWQYGIILGMMLMTVATAWAQNSLPQIDANHWLYFGWEDVHPKAISTMGGALYSRRPMLAKHDDHSWECSRPAWHKDADKPVFFMLSVDGSEPFYPDETSPTRRTDIRWGLAEDIFAFPQTRWEKDGVALQVTHVGHRLLQDSVCAVYSRIVLSNTDSQPHRVALHLAGASVAQRCLPLRKYRFQNDSDSLLSTTEVTLKGNRSVTFDFVIPANGIASQKDILAEGGFDKVYGSERQRILSRMDTLTMPVELPDERFIQLWKTSMQYMWDCFKLLQVTETQIETRCFQN